MSAAKSVPVLPETADVLAARGRWQYDGSARPAFADAPGPEQVSVWDFPRPPVLLACNQRLTVFAGDACVADTRRGVRVLETAGAPTYYFPPPDVAADLLGYGEMSSVCEWKGVAQTLDAAGIGNAGWRYVRMFAAFVDLYEWPSFHPGRLRCYVDDERASPQPGGYYGGWVTADLAGPIKGEPGSEGW